MRLSKIKLFDREITKQEKRFFFLVGLVWAQYPLLHFFEATVARVTGPEIASALLIVLWMIAIVGAYAEFAQKMSGNNILFVVALFVLYIVNYVLFPQNVPALNFNADLFLLSALPCFFIGAIFPAWRGLKFLYYLSLLCILAQYLFSFVYGNNEAIAEEGNGNDQLAAAYLILPHVLIVAANLIQKPDWISGFFFFLGVLILISFGSRGPIVCMILFVLIAIIYKMTSNKFGLGKMILFVLSCLVIVGLFNIFLDRIIDAIMASQNMSDRLVRKMVENQFLESEDRDDIRFLLFSKLDESPYWGYGIAGDRFFLGSPKSGYAHNLVVEVLFSYGYFLGGGILFFIGYLIYKGLRYSTRFEKNFVFLLFTIGIVGLLFSGTYLTNKWFYFFLGYCMSIRKTNKGVIVEK